MPALTQILEALLQASENPLSTGELLTALTKAAALHEEDEETKLELPEDLDEAMVESALTELDAELVTQNRAITVRRRPQGWKILTRSKFAHYIRGLYPDARPSRLSAPALETLAIVAYRQPVTKAEIEAVRGVSVDAMMQKLLDLGLVRIDGRADKPGRPLLFATTTLFLEHFGLDAKEQLPNHDELSRLDLPQPEDEEEPAPEEEQLTLADRPTVNSPDDTSAE